MPITSNTFFVIFSLSLTCGNGVDRDAPQAICRKGEVAAIKNYIDLTAE
jgi:hypothetical protein